ncbi:helix-turn-helix domain-containing protein [Singulisphaera rosea]
MTMEMIGRLERIERMLETLVQEKTVKDWYTTAEVGEILDRDPYTVREWARLGRIRAEKRSCGRGRTKEWVVPRQELERIRNHGLLPLR